MRPAKSEAIQYAATKPGAPIGENDSLGAILERGLSRPWMPSKYGTRAPNRRGSPSNHSTIQRFNGSTRRKP